MSDRIGFIGLGNIGFPMAKNIVSAGFEPYLFDVFAEPVEKLAAKGGYVAANIKEMAQQCDVIGICVRDDSDVEQLLYGADGLLANAKAGAVLAIHSTVTQAAVLRWAKDCAAQGVSLLDAPITSGAQGAKEKTLCYMVGGDSAALARLRPFIETSAKKIVHAGDVGSGIALKLCNNLINYAAFTAIDEASRLAASCGLDPELVYQVGEVNGIVTEMMKRFISGRDAMKPACSEEDFEKIFGPFAQLAEKDLDAALAAAGDRGVSLPSTEKVREGISGVFFKTN